MSNDQTILKGFNDIESNNTSIVSSESKRNDGSVKTTEDSALSSLRWYCAPDSWEVLSNGINSSHEGYGGKWSIVRNSKDDSAQLVIYPPAKKDYWRKTYYEPILVKDDAPFLYYILQAGGHEYYTIETSFYLTASKQFDQAGLMIRLDSDHWLKTGIEVVDRIPRLSCVVTNVYSDWSTQQWGKAPSDEVLPVTTVECSIRIHCRKNNSYVVEAKNPLTLKWDFIRIAHLSRDVSCSPDPLATHPVVVKSNETHATYCTLVPEGCLWVGVYAACPEDQDGNCSVVFHDFSIHRGSSFDHSAENNL